MLFSVSLSVAALAFLDSFASAGHIEKSRIHHNRGLQDKSDSSPSLWKRFSGTATYYAVGLGACGQYNKPSDFIVALNSAQYGGGYPGPNCFKHITITAKGKSVGAVIMDECPTCSYGDLDLSQGLFEQFANTNDGVFQMSWTFSDGSGGGGSSGGSNNDDDDDTAWKSKSSVSAKSTASVASARAEESRASVQAAESWASRASLSDKSVASEASKASADAQESLASVSQYSVTSVAALATSSAPSSTFVTVTTSSAIPTETGSSDAKSSSKTDTSSTASTVSGNNLGLTLQVLKQFGGIAAVGSSA